MKKYRKGGLGSKLLKAAEKYIVEAGGNEMLLHAQLHAVPFYEKHGFSSFGQIEYEESCPHIWMRTNL